MGVLDFLFEGQAPANVTTSGQTVTDMPRWLSDYAQSILSRGVGVGMEPYQAYEGPRIAPFTPDQEAGFDQIRGAAGAHQPNLQQAGALTQAGSAGMAPGAIDPYLNPYITNVTDRAAQLTGRALNEQLLPGLERVFGAAGQDARSSAYRRTADRGVRDLAEGLQAQNLGALSQAYESSVGARENELRRQLGAGQQMGALGELEQSLGLRGGAALGTVGEAQQGQTQRSLDLAHQDFIAQRDYPRGALDWMSGLLTNTPRPASTTTSQTGPPDVVGPSPIAQIGSLATGIKGIWDIFQKARGGRVGYQHGGALAYA